MNRWKTGRERSRGAAAVVERGSVEADGPQRAVFEVPDMDCASCVAKIRGRVASLDGVLEVDGSPVARTLTVDLDPRRVSGERVREEVAKLGYTARPRVDRLPHAPARPSVWRSGAARIAYASMALFAVALTLRLTGLDPGVGTAGSTTISLADLLYVGAALVGGWNFFPRGIRAARALALDMNFLMTVAILGAITVGETMEAAAIAFLFAFSELLERYAVDRARGSVEALMRLAPERARRITAHGSEEWVAPAALVVGDEVAVRPGDRIPADGSVIEGHSAVDEAALTGEPVPVEKVAGSTLFSGTVNREGWLRMRVERPAAESTLARIARMVEEAESRKTQTEQFVERFARVYTPIVTVAAVLVVAVPVVIGGAPFEPWFVRGLTLLVIACPCALVISTPVAVVSGITAAARKGVLIKGGRYLEALGQVHTIAFDKTGTLTLGHPEVVDMIVSPADPAGTAADHEAAMTQRREELLRWAAAVESRSEHPVAQAIVAHAEQEGVRADDSLEVGRFRGVPGRGAEGEVGGVWCRIGSPAWLGVAVPEAIDTRGRTVVGLQVGEPGPSRPVDAWFVLADRPRASAAPALRALRAEGVERTVMLTGDAPEAAAETAAVVGVDEVRARLLPEDKVRAVEELEARYGAVAMVGDGVNDAPALAASTVGIVMGAMGSDVALETADIALMGDDLTRLAYARRMSTRAGRVIRQNITAAIVVKGVLALAVPFGMVSLVTAVVAGDLGVSLAVTLNALRLGAVRDEV